MSVLNFKYVVHIFGFLFIHSPIGSDYLILILITVECLQ